MISHNPSTPLPGPIDDEHLVVESSGCAQPSGLFSRVEWFIATLKLYDLLRKTLNTLYNNTEKQTRDQSVDRGRMETLRQIECITQIDAELQDFRLTVPGPLKWDIPVHESQDQFLRERCLLKARYIDMNPPCVFLPDHLQIFVPENSNLQASSLTIIARDVILPRNRDRT